MRINYLPSILYFGMPMGLIGTGLNAQHLAVLLGLHNDIASWILFYGWISLAIVGSHYIKHLFGEVRTAMQQEWQDPFKRNFFPAITLTLLLLLLSLKPYFDALEVDQAWLSSGYFTIVTFHTILNIKLINNWLFSDDLYLRHHKPTWFVLLSGNFMVIISGVHLVDLQRFPVWNEVLWLFFSMGLFLWLVFTVSLFYRLLFTSPLQVTMRPSLFIFLAPPSLGVIASLLLTQDMTVSQSLASESLSVSPLTWVLYGFATLMLLLWVTLVRFFYQSGLSMAGWAYIYPMAAYGLATQYMAMQLNSSLLVIGSVSVFIFVLILISLLTVWLIKQSLQKVIE